MPTLVDVLTVGIQALVDGADLEEKLRVALTGLSNLSQDYATLW
jgi:hypothetical protein